MLSDQSMTDTLTISNDINILLMDGMGGLTDNKYTPKYRNPYCMNLFQSLCILRK